MFLLLCGNVDVDLEAVPDSSQIGVQFADTVGDVECVFAVLTLVGDNMKKWWAEAPGVYKRFENRLYWNKAGPVLVDLACKIAAQYAAVLEHAIELQTQMAWPHRRVLCVLRALRRIAGFPCFEMPNGETNVGSLCCLFVESCVREASPESLCSLLGKAGYSFEEAVCMVGL